MYSRVATATNRQTGKNKRAPYAYIYQESQIRNCIACIERALLLNKTLDLDSLDRFLEVAVLLLFCRRCSKSMHLLGVGTFLKPLRGHKKSQFIFDLSSLKCLFSQQQQQQ